MKSDGSPGRLRPGLRVLVTEGSSTSARQNLYALAYAGAVIDVCDSNARFCMARYSRYVRKCYRCPLFTTAPEAYLQFLEERLRAEKYDILFPVHDEIFLVSRCRERLAARAALAVANFEALERLQSKAEFMRLLVELNLPHPPTVFVRSGRDLKHACAFPCYIKLAYSTAGRGVFLVHNAEERDAVANRLEAEGRLTGDAEILVQRPAPGLLSVVQTVFQHGRLVAGHCYQARAMGVGGSARARISVSHPLVLQHLAAIGARLSWHGALMIDYLWDPASAQPAYIDANPRIGETFNATLSGLNLCAILVQVALDQPLTPHGPGRAGTRTHSILMTLLAGAQEGQSRLALAAELGRGLSHQGIYAGSEEELTRPRDDLLSLIPALWITGRVLIDPRAAERLVNKTVHNYALSEKAAQAIRRLGAPGEET